jgi:hypothetical protein
MLCRARDLRPGRLRREGRFDGCIVLQCNGLHCMKASIKLVDPTSVPFMLELCLRKLTQRKLDEAAPLTPEHSSLIISQPKRIAIANMTTQTSPPLSSVSSTTISKRTRNPPLEVRPIHLYTSYNPAPSLPKTKLPITLTNTLSTYFTILTPTLLSRLPNPKMLPPHPRHQIRNLGHRRPRTLRLSSSHVLP